MSAGPAPFLRHALHLLHIDRIVRQLSGFEKRVERCAQPDVRVPRPAQRFVHPLCGQRAARRQDDIHRAGAQRGNRLHLRRHRYVHPVNRLHRQVIRLIFRREPGKHTALRRLAAELLDLEQLHIRRENLLHTAGFLRQNLRAAQPPLRIRQIRRRLRLRFDHALHDAERRRPAQPGVAFLVKHGRLRHVRFQPAGKIQIDAPAVDAPVSAQNIALLHLLSSTQ